MLYIFEMANNHQGSVKHAKLIIDKFANLASKLSITAAIKFQFRQLDTFVHEDYKNSDLKFVKRFNSTRLEKDQFSDIIKYAKSNGLKIIATPFDNESIPWLSDLGVDIIKVASCSADDWPLLKQLATISKKIIISTGGVDLDHLQKVYNLFKKNQRDFAFMHCVGEYPTPHTSADMSRITRLQQKFSDIEIGFSTHESPLEKSLAPIAVSLGCTIIEKHVGVKTNEINLNGYSNTPEQLEQQILDMQYALDAMHGKSKIQNNALKTLKRGVYFKKDLKSDDVITIDDLYFALPVQPGQADASMVDNEWGWVQRKNNIVGQTVKNNVTANSPVFIKDLDHNFIKSSVLEDVKEKIISLLNNAGVTITKKDSVEISCHYGIENFYKVGAVIIDKVNREFCKKILVMLPGQKHPVHHHILKEEAFELLHGDCNLFLNKKQVSLKKGVPTLIPRKVNHCFNTKLGCVIEEISTTHHKGDSVYEDANINKLKLKDRKIKINII
jgi:sialic acid synthase SpsE/mannose-6-phosphate isomerase-like protein (cupin superfamily)